MLVQAQLRLQQLRNTLGKKGAAQGAAAAATATESKNQEQQSSVSKNRIQPTSSLANRTELNPVHFLARSATIYPNKTAILHQNRTYTYQELSSRVIAFAYALQQAPYKIQPGDRVAVICPNTPSMLEAHFGIPAARGVICAINTRLVAKEIEYIVNHSGAKMVIVDSEFLDQVKGWCRLPIIEVHDSGLKNDPYEEFLETGKVKAETEGWSGLQMAQDEGETMSICYTSGTTGKPKGVLYSYRSMYLAALGNAIEAQLSLDSKHLFIVPLFHANSWIFPYAVTGLAATHVLIRKVEYDTIWKMIKTHGVTHMNGAPTIMIQLVHHPDAVKLPKIMNCTVAGSAPTATLIQRMRELNMHIVHVYGLTETLGPAVRSYAQLGDDSLSVEEVSQKLARQGHSYLVSDDIMVVDTDMKEVPWDGQSVGEILFRGNLVMKGYHDDLEATKKAFQGGWFHSGDLAVRQPDGYVLIQDRAKDIIISGGENISTIEVEGCISKHPAVLEVAVVAIPSEKWGETPKGFVILKQGQEFEKVSGEEIVGFCKTRMAGFKCPSVIEIVKELPKTSTGKLQKYVLRDREWQGYKKRVN